MGDRYNFGFVNRLGVNNQDFIFKNDNQSHLVKLGTDIYLNDKNALSFYTTQNWFDSNANGRAKITDNNGGLIESSPNTQVSESYNQTYNINYKHNFDDKGHNIEFETTFSKNDSPNFLKNTFLQASQPDYINDINNNRKNTLINLDYTNPISKNGKLEMGLEFRVNNTDNTNNTTQLGFNNSSFTYNRNISSAYINYGHKFGKVSMQLGARFEEYEIKGIFNQIGQ